MNSIDIVLKIKTILEIDPKTIYKKLVTALELSVPLYTTLTKWTKRFYERRNHRSTSPLSQFTLNWFDKSTFDL